MHALVGLARVAAVVVGVLHLRNQHLVEVSPSLPP